MKPLILFAIILAVANNIQGQPGTDSASFKVTVFSEKRQPLEGATIELIQTNDTILIKTAITDNRGTAVFKKMPNSNYYFTITYAGYQFYTTPIYQIPLLAGNNYVEVVLQPFTGTLQNVSVVSRKPFVQHVQGKIVVNPEASVTNAGTTVLEVLEKSPGVIVDKNGNISLQGKAGVMVMIDGKPTYLTGTDLSSLLGSMSSGQVEQIELMTNPPAKYDASGNAGIINIKTKKNKQKGFNGTATITGGQGRYPKANSSLVINYRTGKFNGFLTYSINHNKYWNKMYALRNYYDNNGVITAKLEQPTVFLGRFTNNTLKTGIEYYASPKTTLGLTFTGIHVNRKSNNEASAIWMNAAGGIDSTIGTYSTGKNTFANNAVNINLRHVFNKSQDLSVDIDWLKYDITNEQSFNNRLLATGGYSEASLGNIPAQIDIFSAKADYTLHFGKDSKLETGIKTSHINTDNLAMYQYFDGSQWYEDYGKSNHFLYKENIHALYASYEKKYRRITFQAGIRYEATSYDAHQLGNLMRRDSSFSRNYNGLFPSGYVSYQMDSAHTFSFTASRRIDRPAFQKLNPFVFIINKYTHQRGNPFFLPQYTWNMELTHQYKQLLTTTVSYSLIKNYFSQLFFNEDDDILIYSEGNVGRSHNLGLSVSLQLKPFAWWSLNGQGIFNYKELIGFNGNAYTSSVKQLNFSMNNQFHIGKIYTAELSGFYTTRARNDIQEILYPTGQLSAGVSRPVLKKKGTLRLSIRDIFFTQVMEGFTDFDRADEYFILRRDTRVVNIAFTYRFGQSFKSTRRNNGGAGDEMQRVGTGS